MSAADRAAPAVGPRALSRPAAPASVLRSVAVVGFAFVVSRVLGLAREVILARRFGTSGEFDAYVAAFRVPDLLFLVIMAGAFGSAFIPVFASYLGRDERERAWALASAVLNLAAIAIVATALVAFVFAAPIVRYLVAPGLDPALQEIATTCMRLLLLSPILLGLGIAAKGILEAHHRFELPAFAPVLYNGAIILGALILAPSLGVYGVAVGVVVGAAAFFLLQIPGLVRVGMRYSWRVGFDTPGLREVGRLLVPRVVGQAAFQINFIVVTYFATLTGEERVSALNYAWQLMMLPHGVLALSVSTVIFPTLAQLYDRGDTAALQRTLLDALRPLLFLILPASIGLFAFREAIVQTLFQGGAFSDRSTELVADPLAFLALGLAAYAVVEVLTRVYYAMHDTRTPVVAGIAIVVLNVLLCALLYEPFGHTGLALSLAATTGLEALILLVVLQRRLGDPEPAVGAWFARALAATAAMALVAGLIAPPLVEATRPHAGPRLAQLALLTYAIVAVAMSYLVAARYLGLTEVAYLTGRAAPVARRLRALAARFG